MRRIAVVRSNTQMVIALGLLAAGCGHARQDQLLAVQDELALVRQAQRQQQQQLAALGKEIRELAALTSALREQFALLRRPAPTSSEPVPAAPVASPDYTKVFRRTGTDAVAIRRADLDQLFAKSEDFARGARLVPVVEKGQPVGFRIVGIRPGSVQRGLGLENGDVILEVAGFALTSPDRALEAYTAVRRARSVEIKLRRRGAVRTIKVTIE